MTQIGRIRVVQSPYVTVGYGSLVTEFYMQHTTASPTWGLDSNRNLITPMIDGEILKVVCNYTSGKSTSVWTLKTRDTPTETVLNLTGTQTDTVIYPAHGFHTNDGTTWGVLTSGATAVVPYAVHGSLLASCSGVLGEALQFKIYYR